jgi:hypothetical protein
MYSVVSKRLNQSDAGTDLYVGDDEGDAVISSMRLWPRNMAIPYWLSRERSKWPMYSCWNQPDRRQGLIVADCIFLEEK